MKVIVQSQRLSDIANAIRYVNGATRTYKAREMAGAISQIPQVLRNNHSFRVTINQSPHQTIKVRRYLPDMEQTHTTGFNLTEQFYRLDAWVEPDDGYVAGTLNIQTPFLLDRDVVVEATPATEVQL